MLGRQDREAAEAGLAGDRLEGRRAQDRARPDRRLVDEAVGQAGHDAVAVEHPLGLVAGRRERLGDPLVADQDGATRREQPPSARPGPPPGGPCRGRLRRSSRGRSGRRRRRRGIGEEERHAVGRCPRLRRAPWPARSSPRRCRCRRPAIAREVAGDRDR